MKPAVRRNVHPDSQGSPVRVQVCVLPHPVPRSSVPSLGRSVTGSSQTGSNTHGQKCIGKQPFKRASGSLFLSFVLNSVLLCPVISKDDDKSFTRAPSWRKKFRPKDVRGLAAGCAETHPQTSGSCPLCPRPRCSQGRCSWMVSDKSDSVHSPGLECG